MRGIRGLSLMEKLDVLLIQLSSNPYFDMMSSYRIGQLGLYYLASYADKAGYNVKVKYYDSFDNVSFELPELINECQCKIVGFYVDMENIWAIRLFTSVIKDKCPDVQIIAGGPQITGDPIGSIQTIPHLLCGIIGEGEMPFVKLLQTRPWKAPVVNPCRAWHASCFCPHVTVSSRNNVQQKEC